MERTKIKAPANIIVFEPKTPEKQLLRWRKVGGGALRWNNRIIKPGEVFLAAGEDLPTPFMDMLECLDVVDKNKTQPKVEKETAKELYRLEKTEEDSELYNVVNEFGKPINEEPLNEKDAKELKNALEA